MAMDQELIDVVNAFGADIKAARIARGNLTDLTTTAKDSLVAAINELAGLIGGSGAVIDDNGTSTAVAWSAAKIQSVVDAAKQAVQDSILGGASAAYDTLLELETLATGNASTATALAESLNNRVRFDAPQTLTVAQQQQACANLGIGDPFTDLLAVYNAAKA